MQSDDVAKLALELAEATVHRYRYVDVLLDDCATKHGKSLVEERTRQIEPILRTALAAKDAELAALAAEVERLRIEGQALVDMLDEDAALPKIFDAIDVDLRAALQPKGATHE